MMLIYCKTVWALQLDIWILELPLWWFIKWYMLSDLPELPWSIPGLIWKPSGAGPEWEGGRFHNEPQWWWQQKTPSVWRPIKQNSYSLGRGKGPNPCEWWFTMKTQFNLAIKGPSYDKFTLTLHRGWLSWRIALVRMAVHTYSSSHLRCQQFPHCLLLLSSPSIFTMVWNC